MIRIIGAKLGMRRWVIFAFFWGGLFFHDAYSLASPALLTEHDTRLYKKIFRLQEQGHWQKADKLIAQLQDSLLLGHVQFQRYMHPNKYRSSYTELRDWLKAYNDHPGAARVYRLALRRKPSNYRNPLKGRAAEIPADLKLDSDAQAKIATASIKQNGFSRSERRMLKHIQAQTKQGYVTVAWQYLRQHRDNFSVPAYIKALAYISNGYYRYQKYSQTVAVGEAMLSLPQTNDSHSASTVAWWSGLAAWRLKQYQQAAKLFAHAYENESQDFWLKSAAAFWAGRAYAEIGNPRTAQQAYLRATQTPHSFYGLLAARLLRQKAAIDWRFATREAVPRQRFLQIPSLRRALALAQCGEIGRAESEMRPIIRQLTPQAGESLLALTHPLQLAHSSYSIAKILEKHHRNPSFAALYPHPDWLMTSPNSYNIDLAVTLAFIHQESGFHQRAKSHAGARGLMQLMPATAHFLSNHKISKRQRNQLFQPQVNIKLGQKYIAQLLDNKNINNSLFLAIIAYNAGPGNLLKWQNKIAEQDPLLFIESLPWRETRLYVERVMANIWVYRLRLQQPPTSLYQLAQGQWPRYLPQDKAHLSQANTP